MVPEIRFIATENEDVLDEEFKNEEQGASKEDIDKYLNMDDIKTVKS